MSAFLWIFGVGFVGMHVGWYMMQQRYVPEHERKDHPFIKLYRRYKKDKPVDE